MKYPSDSKIEFKRVIPFGLSSHTYREIFYRIVPSELGFFKRVFCNPWRKVYRAFQTQKGFTNLYCLADYHKEIEPLKTFHDVCEYLEKQNDIMEATKKKLHEEHLRAIENGEEWPD